MTVSARLRERSCLRVYLRLKRRQPCARSFGRLQVRVTVIEINPVRILIIRCSLCSAPRRRRLGFRLATIIKT